MIKHFRYDYNYKLLIITNILSLIFLLLTILSFEKNVVVFWLFSIIFLINIINTFVFINNQGIILNRKSIIIVDFLWFTKIKLIDLKYIEIKEVNKEKKSNLYGIIHEFYHPDTYMWKCEYVYNNGRVFNLIFHLKDGSSRKSYFGWMYKERSIKKVDKIVKKLETFIKDVNNNCIKK